MGNQARRRIGVALRVTAALASAATLAVTGYGWWLQQSLTDGLTTTAAVTRSVESDDVDTTGEEFTALLVGLDSRTDANGEPLPVEVLARLRAGVDEGQLNTDTIILLHVPAGPQSRAVAISFPRDAYVPIAGGHGTHKINSAYRRGAAQTRDRLTAAGLKGPAVEQAAREAGRRTLIATVEALTGVPIDHYAEINLAGFVELTEAIGGVPVCLRNPVREPRSGIDLPAGPQLVRGPDALAFVRQRHGLPDGDLDRVIRQHAFLAGVARKVLSAGTLTDPVRASRLISAVTRHVVVDQGWDLQRIAQRLGQLSAADLEFHTIPTGRPDLATPADGVAVEVDLGAVRDFVQRTLGRADVTAAPTTTPSSIWPFAAETPTTPEPEPFTAGSLTCVD